MDKKEVLSFNYTQKSPPKQYRVNVTHNNSGYNVNYAVCEGGQQVISGSSTLFTDFESAYSNFKIMCDGFIKKGPTYESTPKS